jgi:hypothetical protein
MVKPEKPDKSIDMQQINDTALLDTPEAKI